MAAEGRSAKKRSRISRACDACFTKKDKCDGLRPSCSACVVSSTACTYDRPVQKRGPPTGQKTAFEKKLRNLEAFLGYLWLSKPEVKAEVEGLLLGGPSDPGPWTDAEKRAAWQQSSAAAWVDSRATPVEDSPAPVPGEPEPVVWTPVKQQQTSTDQSFGNLSPPIIPPPAIQHPTSEARYAPAGDIYSQTGSHRYAGPPSGLYMLRSEAANVDGEPWVHSQVPSPASSDDGALPLEPTLSKAPAAQPVQALTPDDLEELDSLLDVYFTRAHPFFPFVDRVRILRWSAQIRVDPQHGDRPHSALIFSLCAVACGFASQPSPLGLDDAAFEVDRRRHARLRAGFMARARDLLLPRLGAEASLDVVQSALLLVMCELVLGRDSKAWVWLGIAIRLGQDIGLHRASAGVTKSPFRPSQADPPTLDADTERRRLTWWTCFSIDTLLSFHLGRPTAIHRSGFECPLPSTQGADEWELSRTPAIGADADRIVGTGSPKWGGTAGARPVRSQTLSGFAALASLCDILHEIHRLYALPPLVHTPQAVEIVEGIRAKLSGWRSSLAAPLAAALDVQALRASAGKPAPPAHIFNLAMLFNTGLILLFRPLCVLLIWSDDPGLTLVAASLDAPDHHGLHSSAVSECVDASNALTEILPRYYHAFGPAQAPPFTAYYLLTATTIQLWAWAKGPTVSTSAVQRLNQLLALFKEMAAHCPAIAKRMRLVQNTLSKRPHVPSTAPPGLAAQTPAAGPADPGAVPTQTTTTTTGAVGPPPAFDDPFALGNFLDFDFSAAYDPLVVEDISLDPALGSFANLFEAVRGSASAFDEERSPYDQTLLQDPAELLNTWAGHLPS